MLKLKLQRRRQWQQNMRQRQRRTHPTRDAINQEAGVGGTVMKRIFGNPSVVGMTGLTSAVSACACFAPLPLSLSPPLPHVSTAAETVAACRAPLPLPRSHVLHI